MLSERSHASVVFEAVRSARSAALSPVAASWCRSALHHRLDPEDRARREPVDALSLKDVRQQNGALLNVAQPVLDQMFKSFGRSGYGVFLSDAQGIILEHRVPMTDQAMFAQIGLTAGGRWGEAVEGTNGIGTCIYEDKPLVIYRDQHFATRNVAITCVDAPVHDPHGKLVAALDVSSCRDDTDIGMADLIATVVRDAARRIERDAFCDHFKGARIIFLGDDPVGGTALLAVDEDNLVVGASGAARARLNLDDASLSTPRLLSQLFGRETAPSFKHGDRAVLRQALAHADGNASQAARVLGIGRATFYRRMQRAGMRP